MTGVIIGLVIGYVLGAISGAFCLALVSINDPGEDEEKQ